MSVVAPTPQWLLCEDRVLAGVEVASNRAERRRGLLGRDSIDGALLLPHTGSVHTIGMRFPIDVAHLAADGTVLRTRRMTPNRVGAFVPRSRSVLECAAGALERWGVGVGDVLELR